MIDTHNSVDKQINITTNHGTINIYPKEIAEGILFLRTELDENRPVLKFSLHTGQGIKQLAPRELNIPAHLGRKLDNYRALRRSPAGELHKKMNPAQRVAAVLADEAALGREIFELYFPENSESRQTFRQFADLLQQQEISRLKLIFSSEIAEFRTLPVEMMRPPADFPEIFDFPAFGLAHSLHEKPADFPEKDMKAPAGPLRILFVTSLPPDAAQSGQFIDLDEEQDRIISALGGLENVSFDFADSARLSDIRQLLRLGNYHLLHLSGHGGADIAAGVRLVLEDETIGCGAPRPVSGSELAEALKGSPALRTVVLSACESGAAASLAESLCRFFPAVIGMRFSVSDEGATEWAAAFYARLAGGNQLNDALAAGRQAMNRREELLRRNRPEVFAASETHCPVLYLNQSVNYLINSSLPEKAEPAELLNIYSDGKKFRSGGFVGRRREICRLRQIFEQKNIAWLQGPGGLGKTTLAVRFADNYIDRNNRKYKVLQFLGRRDTSGFLDELFRAVNIPAGEAEQITGKADWTFIQKYAAWKNNAGPQRLILLFDNFEDNQRPDPQTEYGPEMNDAELRDKLVFVKNNLPTGCKMLFTSRTAAEPELRLGPGQSFGFEGNVLSPCV